MTDRIPVKGVIVSGAATALAEYELADRIPAAYLNLPKGYIDGLTMEWVSANSLRVTSGAAYIPSLDRVLELSASVTKAGLSLSSSSWYHVYLYLNGSTPDIEIVTTAPATAYSGTARAKTADTSRRYIGSFRVGASTTIIKFACSGGVQSYNVGAGSSDVRIISGSSTTVTPFSIASVVPVTASVIRVFLTNAMGGGSLFVGTPANTSFVAIFAGNVSAFDVPFDPSDLRLVYSLTSAGTGTVDAAGFYIER